MLQRSVVEAFYNRYGSLPEQVALAPGRVNLIGEHIDYEGYAVLPMALEQACCVAAGRAAPGGGGGGEPGASGRSGSDGGDGRLSVSNVDGAAYPAAEFKLGPGGAPPDPGACGSWHRYVLAAAHGVREHLLSLGHGSGGGSDSSSGGGCEAWFRGLRLVVGSSVPPGAGLSSSSALVVAAALALLAALGARPAPADVADLARRCERLVGTMGGGMDQAISLMAQPGRAMLIDWNPLRTEPVALPPSAAFVVANCMAPSLKAETADTRFNLRVIECRLAAALLARKLGAAPADAAAVRTLRQVEGAVAARYGAGVQGQLRAVEELLAAGAYSQEQVEAELGLPLEEALAGDPRALRVLAAARGPGFALRRRAAHVFSEAARVLEFRAVAAEAASAEGPGGAGGAGGALARLGALMAASHASCRDDYDCSCAELDELVAASVTAGAAGARLTGAGWGGCAVALVEEGSAAALLSELEARYYAPRRPAAGAGAGGAPAAFATRPAGGARLLARDEVAALLPAAAAGAAAHRAPALIAAGARR
ncbi:MAG: ribosomal protein S5 domain 2-type protein [Monoraphidium minutum]|nr:MAG: ribosomal protein S5 domain 2-type protein [Monoraphidium minutum]